MKVINSTAIEVLPALLDKTKTQSIRHHDKPKYIVGQKVKLLWNQRSKYKWFRDYDGEGEEQSTMLKHNYELDIFLTDKEYQPMWEKGKIKYYFPKFLGTVEITEVFKIKIRPKEWNLPRIEVISSFDELLNDFQNKGEIEDLAKRDGFVDANKMFKYFDKVYDLSSAKEFWVYHWRWC